MLKSNKGITLTSLIIYLIIIVFVSGTASTMLGYFYKNSDQMIASNLTKEQYTRFLSFISKDVNSKDVVSCSVANGTTLTFNYPDNKKHEYIYQNKAIYYSNPDPTNKKKILLCRDVSENGTDVFQSSGEQIQISVVIGNEQFEKKFTVKTTGN